MKIELSILIIFFILFIGCNSKTEKVIERNGEVEGDSNSIEVNKPEIVEPNKENSKPKAKFFYPVYTEDAIMIFDSVGIGLNCYLLDLQGKSITKTRTTEHKLYWTEIFEKKVTLTEATDTTKFHLTFIGDTAKIKWIQKTEIENDSIKNSILSTFNISNYGGLFENYGGPISMYAEQLKENPKVETINFNNETLYFITYRLESYPDYIVNGPSF